MKIVDFLPTQNRNEQNNLPNKQQNKKVFQQLLQAKIEMAQQLTNQVNSGTNSTFYPNNGSTSFLDLLGVMRQNETAFSNSALMQPVVSNAFGYGINELTSLYSPSTRTQSNSTSSSNFNDIIREAASTYGIDEKLIHAVIQMESSYNPRAKSRAGAGGLMQLMPATARSLGVTDVFDPRQNIFGGTKYLRDMLRKFNGEIELALAAYNAGPGNVQKYGGIPPFRETQNYVRNVLNAYRA